jgi:ADP-heptose:LPS heptosyltransferase
VWPVGKWISLVQALRNVVLLWSPGAADDPRHPGDDARAAAIASRAGPGVALVPARTERLEDLVAVLSLCETFVGADGGAMHIAAGLGLPVVALFENLPYKRRHWHPWQVPHEMVWPETRDIADIPVERVLEAWRRLESRPG